MQLTSNIRPATASNNLRDQHNTMTTLNATLISDDEYRKGSKPHRSSGSGPSAPTKSSTTNRVKDTIPTRSSVGGYPIPTQSKDPSKRASSQKVTAQTAQSHNFSLSGGY